MTKQYKSTVILSTLTIMCAVFSFVAAAPVAEATSAAPIVSIGVGNGNVPANLGPVHGNVYNGDIAVYATVDDTDLQNYHFRVIKDGGVQGHSCSDLFAPISQGYASTTLGKTACGFNFNQSVYLSSGFTDTLIATLHTSDLAAFGGDGDYWLIIGALDEDGNRSSSDYLTDPKIKITIDSSATSTNPVPPVTPPTTPAPSTGSSNGSAPQTSAGGTISGVTGGTSGTTTTSAPKVSSTGSSNTRIASAFPGANVLSTLDTETGLEAGTTTATSTATTTDEAGSFLAAAGLSGYDFNWWWLLLLIPIAGIAYYFMRVNRA